MAFEITFEQQLKEENLELRRKVAAFEQSLLFKQSPESELKE